ncbi:uncharacterized protein [Hyperolius riggenbachi]|uniref:uncharacterized protein n=1 Tax=Hyperolius riggenbachi TaxID=752182 RepID=UPI0035A38A89
MRLLNICAIVLAVIGLTRASVSGNWQQPNAITPCTQSTDNTTLDGITDNDSSGGEREYSTDTTSPSETPQPSISPSASSLTTPVSSPPAMGSSSTGHITIGKSESSVGKPLIIVPCVIAILILAACVTLLVKKRKPQSIPRSGGACAEVLPQAREMEAVTVPDEGTREGKLLQKENKPDHEYQEMEDSSSESAEVMENPQYVSVDPLSREKQSGPQAPPPEEGSYSLLMLPAQEPAPPSVEGL